MGERRDAIRRALVHGLFMRDGVVYSQRSKNDQEFRLMRTAEEREEYLAPRPIDLANARVFLDTQRVTGSAHHGGIIAPIHGVGVFVPVSTRDKAYWTITVYDGDNNVFVAWSKSQGSSRKFARDVQRAIWTRNNQVTRYGWRRRKTRVWGDGSGAAHATV